MIKATLKEKLRAKKATDYSYMILLFISFAFFTFFVIRPNVLTIFSLQEELGKLHILDTGYENVIKKIIDIQTFLEENRTDLYLLDEALPSLPQINKIVDDTQYSASASALKLNSMALSNVDLKDKAAEFTRKKISINIDGGGNFLNSKKFINDIVDGRRLKTIKQLNFSQDSQTGTQSGALKIIMEIEGYYL